MDQVSGRLAWSHSTGFQTSQTSDTMTGKWVGERVGWDRRVSVPLFGLQVPKADPGPTPCWPLPDEPAGDVWLEG